jgi:hypothetical protein
MSLVLSNFCMFMAVREYMKYQTKLDSWNQSNYLLVFGVTIYFLLTIIFTPLYFLSLLF